MSISAQWGYSHGSSVTPPHASTTPTPSLRASPASPHANATPRITAAPRYMLPLHRMSPLRRAWQKITTEITKNGQSLADQACMQ
jgi:hypothetical protein